MPAEDTLETTAPERFDFGQAGHISTDQFRILRSVDEQFARSLTNTLSAWLRTNLAVTPQPAQQGTFKQFLEKPERSYMIPVELPDHHVRGVLRWPFRLVSEVVDLLLGGSGSVAELDRDLTEIEEAVLLAVLEIVMRELNTAWQYIGVRFEMGERERDGQERALMAAQEKIVSLHFELAMPSATAELSFCFPSSALNTSLRLFAANRAAPRQRSEEELSRIRGLLSAARIKAGMCFPPVLVSADELLRLQPGSILRLPLSQNTPGELRLGDKALFEAMPVRTGERRAARVTVSSNAA